MVGLYYIVAHRVCEYQSAAGVILGSVQTKREKHPKLLLATFWVLHKRNVNIEVVCRLSCGWWSMYVILNMIDGANVLAALLALIIARTRSRVLSVSARTGSTGSCKHGL